jgi:L-ribulose-5-phosphate 4-epimerase
MIDEGYIKFTVHLTEMDVLMPRNLPELNAVRTELYEQGMIGILPEGIGFGNVSLREPGATCFFISGTATGGKRILDPTDYCRADHCSALRNEVFCSGHIRASSETLSHDAVYQANPAIECVIHIHHNAFFHKLLADARIPATSPQAAFGTPEMATDIGAIIKARKDPSGLLVMTGHQDGIIAWGSTVSEAYEVLINNFTGIME